MKGKFAIAFILSLFFLLLGLNGCSGAGEEETQENWATEKTVTITIEGMEEEINVRLFRDENLGIKTYYPAHMEAVLGEERVGFYYLWDGEINEKAYIKFSWIYPEKGTSAQEMVANPNQIFPGEGWNLDDEKAGTEPWHKAVFLFSNRQLDRAGVIEMGNLGEKYFWFITQYQYEYGDGIFPRAELIKENLFFLQEGDYLTREKMVE